MTGWGKFMESGTNSRRSSGVWKIRQDSNVRKRISEREEETLVVLPNVVVLASVLDVLEMLCQRVELRIGFDVLLVAETRNLWKMNRTTDSDSELLVRHYSQNNTMTHSHI